MEDFRVFFILNINILLPLPPPGSTGRGGEEE